MSIERSVQMTIRQHKLSLKKKKTKNFIARINVHEKCFSRHQNPTISAKKFLTFFLKKYHIFLSVIIIYFVKSSLILRTFAFICSVVRNYVVATAMAALGIRWIDSQNARNGCRPANRKRKYNFRFRPAV